MYELVNMTVKTLKRLKALFFFSANVNQAIEIAINSVTNMDIAVIEARRTGCIMGKYDDKIIVTKTIDEFLEPEPQDGKPTESDELLLKVKNAILDRIDASIKRECGQGDKP